MGAYHLHIYTCYSLRLVPLGKAFVFGLLCCVLLSLYHRQAAYIAYKCTLSILLWRSLPTAAAILQLVPGNGRYLWRPGPTAWPVGKMFEAGTTGRVHFVSNIPIYFAAPLCRHRKQCRNYPELLRLSPVSERSHRLIVLLSIQKRNILQY